MLRPSSRPGLGLALVCLLAAAGCTLPRFKGPQIQNAGAGFFLQNDSYQGRRMFADREVSMHTAWIKTSNGPYSGIYVNEHPGVLTREDVEAAQVAARAASEHPETTFGEIESLTIDGRTAWGWSEMLATPTLGLDWVAYRTVVAYDDVSYAIEFYSGDPGIKPFAPDTLRTIVASFAIGKTEWNLPLIAIVAGLMVFGVSVLRTRSRERNERLSRINLVKVTSGGDEDGGKAAPRPAASRGSPPLAPNAAPAGTGADAAPGGAPSGVGSPAPAAAPGPAAAPATARPPAPPAAPTTLGGAGKKQD